MFDLTTYFTPADIQRGRDWSTFSNEISLVELAIDLAVLVAFSIGRPGRWLWEVLSSRLTRSTLPLDRILGSDWRTGAVFLGVVTLVRNLSTFPIFLYAQFVVAHRIGLSNQSLWSFVRHTVVATFVVIAAAALLGGILPAVRLRWPKRWWLGIGACAAVALIADAALEPMRLHYHFHVQPLPQGALRTRIETLAQSLNAHLGPVVVIDASTHGTEANAYVTGFGPTQEVVITDTMLALGDEAVMGAVAHELGHRHDKRTPIRLAEAGLGMIALLWLVEQMLRFAARHGAPHTAQGLPLVTVAIAMILLVVLPLRMSQSRDEEREADKVELTVRRDYDAYIAEQVELVRSNAMDPDPPGILRPFMSHPSPAERIDTALSYKARMAP